MKLKILSDARNALEEVSKTVTIVVCSGFFWGLGCVATVGVATGIYGFLYELYYFLRYGNWPRAIDLLIEADISRWVIELDWVGLKWLFLHWPLSAVGLGTALVMFLLMAIVWAWTEDYIAI